LRRIERRLVGGARGGSGQYVYELGRRGYFMFWEGRYNPSRAVSHHSLAIADTYLALIALERSNELRIVGLATEPDCWATVGGVELKPDLRVDVDLPAGRRIYLWLEIDMGTESQKQLRGKLDAYWRAYSDADARQWPVFPRCIWIAVDEERATELRWLITQMPEQSRPLFSVTLLAQLPAILR
jgi:hypothetical protein